MHESLPFCTANRILKKNIGFLLWRAYGWKQKRKKHSEFVEHWKRCEELKSVWKYTYNFQTYCLLNSAPTKYRANFSIFADLFTKMGSSFSSCLFDYQYCYRYSTSNLFFSFYVKKTLLLFVIVKSESEQYYYYCCSSVFCVYFILPKKDILAATFSVRGGKNRILSLIQCRVRFVNRFIFYFSLLCVFSTFFFSFFLPPSYLSCFCLLGFVLFYLHFMVSRVFIESATLKSIYVGVFFWTSPHSNSTTSVHVCVS